ncbi:carboxymuconolactone decarboxylase family protein [Dyella choica]|uniref:Carboxymuconolactone decarboxylase family protein n=1 Tax=Dyella choica TaxID=1927959 RepID=A0A432M244_9GAMM|nr:carboxymuconolactone decarboxylase family protein [Dyella choica]RUL72172.1 carboxymuconolactone decarboxylase family protein [Dyella choica]
MPAFPIHTVESAPPRSKPPLEALRGAFGVIPNIAGAMATSPVLIDSLVGLFGKIHSGSFSEAQIQIVLLTNAVTNACSWAVAFHSFLAMKEGVDVADVDAIRERRLPREAKNAALSTLARTLIERRGHLGDQDASAFLQAGFDEHHLLEVVAIVAASTITNYTGNITHPPLEETLQASRWHTRKD